MGGALEGIKVLDLSRVLAGPYCAQILGDYGADVVKVEMPNSGDDTRSWGPPWVGDQSAYFLSANRNKKSLTLNFKHKEGVEILLKLLEDADVLIENFRPGTTARLGIDYEALRERFPALIYCSISGYGQTGPYSQRPGYDALIQAQGGMMSITGDPDGEPTKVGVAIVDIGAGMFAAQGILAALHHRNRCGRGQHVDVSLMDTQVAWLANVAHNFFASGENPKRFGNAHPNIVPYETFSAKDGYITVAVGTDRQFKSLCGVIGLPELGDDPDYSTNSARVVNRAALIPLLQERFAQQTVQELIGKLLVLNVPAGPVNDIPTALSDPQVLSRGMVQSVSLSSAGETQLLGPVAKLSETATEIYSAPPELGADTDSILASLGYSRDETARLRDGGAV